MPTRRLLSLAVLAVAAVLGRPAAALTLQDPTHESSLVGEAVTFRAVVSDASGVVRYTWDFGDGTAIDEDPAAAQVTHTFTEAQAYRVKLVVSDDGGGFDSRFFAHVAHYPLAARPPTSSTSIVCDTARSRVYSVNQDNDSIAAIDTAALTRTGELPVYRRPEALALAPNGKLWVVHRDDYAVAIVDPDRFVIERGFRLPYASQPMGIAFSPSGDAAYITLMALGQLVAYLQQIDGDQPQHRLPFEPPLPDQQAGTGGGGGASGGAFGQAGQALGGAAGSAGAGVIPPTAPSSCAIPGAGAGRAWLGGAGALATLLAAFFARRRRARPGGAA